MDDTPVTLDFTDIELLEDPELNDLIDVLTDELQHLPRVRLGRRFSPPLRPREDTTVAYRRHRTWHPSR